MKKKTSWSLSSVKCFESCPRMYEGKYLKGMKSKPGPAAERGLNIHARAESYLLGKIRAVPSELLKLKKPYINLKKSKPLVELKLAVNEAWKPTSWKIGWARGALDALTVIEDEIILIDHKTGQIYPSHEEQGEVYACLVSANTEADKYVAEFWYIDQGEIVPYEFDAKDIPDLKRKWTYKAKRVLTAKKYPATPSQFSCRYCPVSSKRGGPCREWRKVLA